MVGISLVSDKEYSTAIKSKLINTLVRFRG
jgi:hypothetical protein